MHGRVNAIDVRARIMLTMVLWHVRLPIQRAHYYTQFQVAKYLTLPWISKAIYAQEKILFFIGFRLQTCKKLWYLNIYLRFALENLFSFNKSFSPVIFKGIIHPQSSQNEILGYSSWNLATPNSFKIRYSYSWLLLRQEAMSQRSRGKEDTALTSLNPCYFAYFLNQPFHSYVQNIISP